MKEKYYMYRKEFRAWMLEKYYIYCITYIL